MLLRALEFAGMSFALLMVISLLVAVMVRIISAIVQRKKAVAPEHGTEGWI